MLVAAYGVTGLGTCIDAVKMLGTEIQVKSQCGEVVIPVGVFDYHLNVLVDLFGRTQDHVQGGVIHQFQTVIGP